MSGEHELQGQGPAAQTCGVGADGEEDQPALPAGTDGAEGGQQQHGLQQEDEDGTAVWRLLLSKLWGADDVHACAAALLGVSRSMQALLHGAAAGRLALVGRSCYGAAVASAACGWLAQHAVLLQELTLEQVELDAWSEELFAAGLRAAAGAPGMAGGGAACEDAPGLVRDAEESAATAALQHRSAGEQPAAAHGLPLCRARISGSFGGTLLRSLASCCPQLTGLDLLTRGSSAGCLARPPAASALSAMTALRELRAALLGRGAEWGTEPGPVLPDLRPLTQLSQLRMAYGLCAPELLPASLQGLACWELGAGADLCRLTALQELVVACGCVREGVKLPHSLQRLTVLSLGAGLRDPSDLEPPLTMDDIAPLPQLRSLYVATERCAQMADIAAQLQRATQLTAVDVGLMEPECGPLSHVVAALPQLPLTALRVEYGFWEGRGVLERGSMQQLHRLSALTALQLFSVRVRGSAAELAAQLVPLRAA